MIHLLKGKISRENFKGKIDQLNFKSILNDITKKIGAMLSKKKI